MGLYEELLTELARSAVANPGTDVESLQREVAALRRIVARMAELIAARDAERPTAAVIRRSLLDEAEGPLVPSAAEEEPAPPVFEGSPYRGPVNGNLSGLPGQERCRRCHKRLEADDPDLEGEEGRICMACFQRGADVD